MLQVPHDAGKVRSIHVLESLCSIPRIHTDMHTCIHAYRHTGIQACRHTCELTYITKRSTHTHTNNAKHCESVFVQAFRILTRALHMRMHMRTYLNSSCPCIRQRHPAKLEKANTCFESLTRLPQAFCSSPCLEQSRDAGRAILAKCRMKTGQ